MPNVERAIPKPRAPPTIAFRSAAPSRAEILQVIPEVQVWRAGGTAPQRPARNGQRLETAYVADNNPILVRLQFGLLAAGKSVTITGASRIAIEAARRKFLIPPPGECLVSLKLDESAARGHITFSCEGQTTTLPLARGRSELVAAREQGGIP